VISRLGLIGFTIALFLLITGTYLHSSGYGALIVRQIVMASSKPGAPFNPAETVPRPAYTDINNWAAFPGLTGPATLVATGLNDAVTQGEAPVDVFYIHPTGYLSGASWTSPMNKRSAAEENTEWMMAYQASAFNGCCNVYAPRYREASIYAYLADTTEERDAVLEFAYQDVEAAFDYYIEHHNRGRPFIIASHSQGTHHATRLIQRRIDSTPLYQRMVAGYLLGATVIGIRRDWLDQLHNISLCQSADDVACIVHWDTVAENGRSIAGSVDTICINPLAWNKTSDPISANQHRGALEINHLFINDFGYDNSPQRTNIEKLGRILPGLTSAECRNGRLIVNRMDPDHFEGLDRLGNYHVLDYTLFYKDIRDNAKLRANTFLARTQPSDDDNLSGTEPWQVPGHAVPLPQAASTALRDAIHNGPVPDRSTRLNHPTTDAEWSTLQRQRDELLGRPIAGLLQKLNVRAEHQTIGGVAVARLLPDRVAAENSQHLFVYLHGGAYVYRSGDAGLGEGIVIANRLRIPVISIDYAMPPAQPFPAAVDDVIAVYQQLLRQYSESALIIGGTSAGGGLALASIHRMKQLELPVPAAVYAGTPWADLSKTGDTLYSNENLDRILVTYDGSLGAAARLYAAGHDLRKPLLSPVYGDFSGFPPTILVSGTRDLFLSDVVRTHRKLRAADVDAELHVFEGMSHADYIAVADSPESLEVYRELSGFVAKHLQ